MGYVAARVVTDRQTDTHTHTQNDYCNPTVHAPRVNNCHTFGSVHNDNHGLAIRISIGIPSSSEDLIVAQSLHTRRAMYSYHAAHLLILTTPEVRVDRVSSRYQHGTGFKNTFMEELNKFP